MIDPSHGIEGRLQHRRFRRLARWCEPPIVDVGGNRGELGAYLGLGEREYRYTNLIPVVSQRDCTLVFSAVLEHLPAGDLSRIPRLWPRRVVATTPAPASDPVLNLLARLGMVEAANIAEHKQYFTKNGLAVLFDGMTMVHYERFDVFNQLVVWERK